MEGTGGGDTVAELRKTGIPAQVLAEIERVRQDRPQADDAHWVDPGNWNALKLFLALETQWDRAGLNGARTGLNYSRIRPVLEARPDIDANDYPDLFQRLQAMEQGALEALAERN